MNVTHLLSIGKCFSKLPILKKERNFLKLTDMNGKGRIMVRHYNLHITYNRCIRNDMYKIYVVYVLIQLYK